MERLLELGRSLVGDLELKLVLERLLEAGRELTGARYAALGILDPWREKLEQFLTVGMDEPTRRELGDLPRGHGVLGVLIHDPRLRENCETSASALQRCCQEPRPRLAATPAWETTPPSAG